MNEKEWLSEYLEQYQQSIFGTDLRDQLVELKGLLQSVQAKTKKVILAGNGGSASIASHCAVDFTKSAGVRCINFNEPDLITCLANDYGYERWIEKALEFYAEEGDLVILISSSGKSPNMLRAAEFALSKNLTLVTFTGFDHNNPLRSLGKYNFWVNSFVYNVVEMTHHIWLLAVCDLLVHASTYQPVEN